MSDDLRHPLFARFFNRFSQVMERDVGPLRDEMTRGLEGRVLELGAGNGINFSRYPSSVREVVAVEPEPFLRARAEEAARQAPVPVRVQAGVAGALGLKEASFDAAVCSLVLCSVADQRGALEELRAALRPGGELRFLEHVRGDGPVKAAVQRGLDGSRVWPALAGGCHCGRTTLAEIEAVGFDITEVGKVSFGPAWLHTNPHVTGIAVVPA